ncbi:hypothetical protein ACUXCC_000579 [Cytobacillus horneckiae]
MLYVFEDEPVQLKTINATKFYEKKIPLNIRKGILLFT